MSDAVPTIIAATLTHEMILMTLVDFFALKYLQAKVNIMRSCESGVQSPGFSS